MKASLIRAAGAVLLLGLALHASAADKVDFALEIKPILESTCLSCHGPEKPKGDLRLDTRANALKGGDGGASLGPGQPQKSSL